MRLIMQAEAKVHVDKNFEFRVVCKKILTNLGKRMGNWSSAPSKTLKPDQNNRHYGDDILKDMFRSKVW